MIARISLRTIGVAILWTIFVSLPALARVGGGQSYSGGGSSGGGFGGGGGYSGGGDVSPLLVFDMIRLIFAYPLVGFPLVLIVFLVIWQVSKHPGYYYTTGTNAVGDSSRLYPGLFGNIARSQSVAKLQELDPEFSEGLFMDFAYSLFAAVHRARGERKLPDYSNYLGQDVLADLEKLTPAVSSVDAIIVGAAHLRGIRIEEKVRITVEFEANYTETSAGHEPQSWYAQETWTFVRDRGVTSLPPARILALHCPACGAPLGQGPDGKCPSCGKRNEGGEFGWFVEARRSSREARDLLLTSDVPEAGTDLPTLLDPQLSEEVDALKALHPDFAWPAFSARIGIIFTELQQAWTKKRWDLARPYESDRIFQTHLYWISAYEKQSLTNILKDIRIEKTVAVRVQRDRYYVAITVRIYASMTDYTVNAAGETISGNPKKPRRFSEYWTFIRTHDAVKPKGASNECPSCGAPFKINMAGVCEFCNTKITSGNFDWVLSEIEQDESYAG